MPKKAIPVPSVKAPVVRDADKPSAGCVLMERGAERAEVNDNSIELMEALGWRLIEAQLLT